MHNACMCYVFTYFYILYASPLYMLYSGLHSQTNFFSSRLESITLQQARTCAHTHKHTITHVYVQSAGQLFSLYTHQTVTSDTHS
jgi:hypothetical protein